VNYFLHTNAVVAVLKNQPGFRKRLRRAAGRGNSIAVSSVVLFELWYGVARSNRSKENAERLRVFLSGTINVVPFSEEDAKTAGALRTDLEAMGKPIGPYDLLIATQALRNHAALVTANVSEFRRAGSDRPGLVCRSLTRASRMPLSARI
jgi:tRNA(fMet)-specific endonuclease VapC